MANGTQGKYLPSLTQVLQKPPSISCERHGNMTTRLNVEVADPGYCVSN